jgi:magnesium transporter
MLEENDSAGMKALCEDLHPATVAEILTEELGVELAWKFLEQTSIRNQAAIFEYFPIDWQVKMVEGTGRQHMAKLVEQMSHDDRVDLLRRLMPRVTEQLLRLVDEADRRDIATLVSFPENSAGALMTTDYAWLPANISVSEAIERLRLQAPDRETIYYVYVLDEQRKLLGILSLRDLILAPRHVPIRDIMEKEVVAACVTDDREKVAQDFARFDFLAMPVVDPTGKLVGIVTHDDVMAVIVQEATEDAQRQGGVGVITENYLEAGFVKVWRKRAFWLACLFAAELTTFTAMAYFDEALKAVFVLSMFIPLVISTGGNSGSQAATLITRALALGHVSMRDWFRVLCHELIMGLALGFTLGFIGFFRAWFTPGETLMNPDGSKTDGLMLAIVISQSVAGICLWGTLVGSMLPLLFKRIGVDPGIASSPFVATFVDVTGMVIYFSIATVYLL